MANIFNNDFRDFIQALNDAKVKYILVGGYAVILHGYNRTTGDMDLWVERTAENYLKIAKAFYNFGMPLFDMTLDKFLNEDEVDVFRFGKPPVSIDLMNRVKGMNFNDCFSKATLNDIDGISINLIHLNDLIIAKQASNRAKDQNDIEHLKKQ